MDFIAFLHKTLSFLKQKRGSEVYHPKGFTNSRDTMFFARFSVNILSKMFSHIEFRSFV